MVDNPFEGKYVWDYLKPENNNRSEILSKILNPYIQSSEKVLDINCGFSPLAGLFLSNNCDFTGFDISEEAIAYAKERFKKANFFVSDDSSAPVPSDLDVIIHLGVTGGKDRWNLESKTEIETTKRAILNNLPRMIILESAQVRKTSYETLRDFVKELSAYELKEEREYDFKITNTSTNAHANSASKRIISVFTKNRSFCSLQDSALAALITELGSPNAQRTTVPDLNLGFGFLYYSLARTLRPRLTIVLGSKNGFSPIAVALGIKDNSNGGRLILVDAGYSNEEDGKETGTGGIGFWRKPDKVDSLLKKFGVQDIVEVKVMKTSEFVGIWKEKQVEKVNLLIIDADHKFEGVKHDFEAFSKFMEDDGVIVFHDTMVEYGYNGYPFGVKKYVENVLKTNSEYESFTLPIWPGLGFVRKQNRTLAQRIEPIPSEEEYTPSKYDEERKELWETIVSLKQKNKKLNQKVQEYDGGMSDEERRRLWSRIVKLKQKNRELIQKLEGQ